MSGPNQSENGSQQKTTSTTNQNGGGSHSKSGKAGATQDSKVKVPDPNASTDPKVGRQAGVGDDPANLNVADPDTGKAGSGGRQAHATR